MRFETFPFHLATGTTEDDGFPPGAVRVVRGDDDLHPEDAFLREYSAFLRGAVRLSPAEHAVAQELARAALDHVDGVEGDFAALPVDAWIVAAMPARARERVGHDAFGRLALWFVTFLSTSERIQPLAARRLRRAIAGLDRPACANAA